VESQRVVERRDRFGGGRKRTRGGGLEKSSEELV
jgi:hypothetical protein